MKLSQELDHKKTLLSATDIFNFTRFNEDIALDLKLDRNPQFIQKDLSGPAIYTFFYRNKLIYLGSYKHGNLKIFNDRWKRHFTSFTLRGKDLSFGRRIKNNSEKINRIWGWFTSNEELKEFFSKELIEERQKDGYVASVNRTSFAVENWGSFREEPGSWLDDFQIAHYKLSLDSDRCFANCLLMKVEKKLIEKCNPRCNREYKYNPNEAEYNYTIEKVDSALTDTFNWLKCKY